MRRVRVKICGIRSLEEALVALELGADAIGFNLWPRSPRYVDAEKARDIIAQLPPLMSCIGVFVNEKAEKIEEIAARARLDGIQLHGDESPEFCNALEQHRICKAFRVGDGFDLKVFDSYRVNSFLLDAHVKGEYGGTGKHFDWSIAAEAARRAPVILAGGLTSDNVAYAIRTVSPFGVDVCSGVEAEPGRKDPDKMRSFMEEVSRANSFLE
jgi:phosphoribosylanthranilate isomerase